jgi:ABC-type glycerol-3-phosphate transport system substrate-binding protein
MKNMVISLFLLVTSLFLLFITLNPVYTENDGQIEIAHGWLSGKEAEAFERVKVIFERTYPSLHIINAVTTQGSGFDPTTFLKARLLAGDMPDAYMVFKGCDFLDTWVADGIMESLTFIFTKKQLFTCISR